MSHLAKGMVVPVIGSLVVAFSLLCMAKEFTSLLAFQCRDSSDCCCHSYIIFRIINYNVDRYCERRTALAPCLLSYRFSGVYAAQLRLSESNDACINCRTDGAVSTIKLAWMVESRLRSTKSTLAVSQPFGCKDNVNIWIMQGNLVF